ncbi:MAG TPA: hypothetical protein VFN33_07500, partial [Gaiellaceae bacterium]|nr:hypothetical protein [Gaiellaceae bacterium]
GKGMFPHPQPDPQRVLDRFGEREGVDLLAYCEGVMKEMYDLEPDWSVEDLDGASERAVTAISARHPELSPIAIDALHWSYMWDWK